MGLKMVLTFAKWWPKGLSAALVVLGMSLVSTTQAYAQQLRTAAQKITGLIQPSRRRAKQPWQTRGKPGH